MNTIVLASISGGKDSLASYIETTAKWGGRYEIIPYFCDTGWEHELTYDYLDYIESKIGAIVRLKSDKYDGFEDMCIKRKMIPSRVKRFCTEELKVFPSVKFMREWKAKGYRIINVVGVRKDESKKREPENMWKTTFLGKLPSNKSGKRARAKYYTKENTITTYQPVVYWNTLDIFTAITKAGFKNNPLYSMGYSRVGCYPCIQAKVNEIGMLDDKTVARVTTLEEAVSLVAGAKILFWHKGGIPVSMKTRHRSTKYNSLGLELGCINQFGICE